MAARLIPATFCASLWSDSQAVISILSLMVVTNRHIYLLDGLEHLIAFGSNPVIPRREREPILALAGEIR